MLKVIGGLNANVVTGESELYLIGLTGDRLELYEIGEELVC